MRKKFWRQKALQMTELHEVVEEEEDLEILKVEPQRTSKIIAVCDYRQWQ
jgi:hypothetical protein